MYEEMKELFHHYIGNQSDYVEKYNGRVIVLKDFEVIGVYDSEIEAVQATQAAGHEPGTFLVQKVTPGTDAYTVHIATPHLIHA